MFEQTGGGLNFINAMRRAYPKDPALDNQTYMGLIGYLGRAAKEYSLAGTLINRLGLTEGIDINLMPRNFFVATAGGEQGRFLVRYRYISSNPATGQRYLNEGYRWIDQMIQKDSLFTELSEHIQSVLDVVAVSAQAQRRYQLDRNSLEITAVIRRF